MRVDTSIATKQIKRCKANNNVVKPSSPIPGKFVQFASDKINILEEILYEKGQFSDIHIFAFQDASVCVDNRSLMPTPPTRTTINCKDRSITAFIPHYFHETVGCVNEKSRVCQRLPTRCLELMLIGM